MMMGKLDPWDVALLAAAGYVAVASLARLMLLRRDRLLAELRRAVVDEKRHKSREAARRPRHDEAA